MKAAMSPFANEKYRVLVVDDDPSVLATYRRLLKRAGYTTVAESDPRQVLANGMLDQGIDLILVDYKMPGMDGLTFLSQLRRRECKARCILISAYLNDELRSQARNLGVDRVLDKPVDCCILRQVINELLPLTRSVKATG
jgi:CheY-like chemotaxis protein